MELCCGFSQNGLPLGMQVIGRPFDDARVMKVAHAYEKVAGWRSRRPPLAPGAVPPPIDASANAPVVPDLDAKTRAHVERMAAQAGLRLDERRMAIFLEGAPWALAMAGLCRREYRER